MGSVSPLLAVVPHLRAQQCDVRFVGTRGGPERAVVERAGIPFYTLVAPKLRRYVSLWYVLVPFQLLCGLVQSLVLLLRWRPDVIVSAGSYVSVPLVWIGWMLRIPSVIHQQDIAATLSNRLMAPCATTITVAFEDTMNAFTGSHSTQLPSRDRPKTDGRSEGVASSVSPARIQWIGNPVRDLAPTTNVLHLDASVPTVLIVGGGTGAQGINALVSPALCESANVIHVTGKGRAVGEIRHPRYHSFEFLGEELKEALAKADVVVSRAGLGFITELIAVGKPTIIIPMPHSHQEQNAAVLKKQGAALVLEQATLTTGTFDAAVQKVLHNKELQQVLTQRIRSLSTPNATKAFITVILSAAS